MKIIGWSNNLFSLFFQKIAELSAQIIMLRILEEKAMNNKLSNNYESVSSKHHV